MNPECLLFTSRRAPKKRLKDMEIAAVAAGLRAVRQAAPKLLIEVHWKTTEYDPVWLLLIRANYTADILCQEPSFYERAEGKGAQAAFKALGITLGVGSVLIGPTLRIANNPFPLVDVFPGDKEFAELLRRRAFVKYLDDLAAHEAVSDCLIGSCLMGSLPLGHPRVKRAAARSSCYGY